MRLEIEFERKSKYELMPLLLVIRNFKFQQVGIPRGSIGK